MKKYVLTNSMLPSYLLYGGLLLIFLRTPLVVNDLIGQKSFLNSVLLGTGAVFILAGFVLRFYHARQSGQQKSFLFSIGVGLTVLVVLMATGLIHAPGFLQNMF